MLKKGGRSLIVIVILGALVFFAVSAFFAGLANDQEVVTAKIPLSAGTRLSAAVLEVRRMNSSAVLSGAFSSIDELKGQVLVAARLPGDQITKDMVGASAISALAASLPNDRAALAVKVDQASGLAGVVRVGDLVGAIGIVTAQDLGVQDNANGNGLSAFATPTPLALTSPLSVTVRPTPKPQMPAGASARIALGNLKVLVVPQSFRYEETAPNANGDTFTSVRATESQQKNSVIVLEVPIAPIEVAPGIKASPLELLALLNEKGRLHFFLQSPTTQSLPSTSGVDAKELLEKFYGTPGGAR